MTAIAQVCHATPHRTRLAIPARKKDELFFGRLGKALSACSGVRHVKTNPLTASVVIEHHRALTEVLEELNQNQSFKLVIGDEPLTEALATKYNRSINASINKMDETILDWTRGELDFASIAGLSLTGLALYQMRRGMFLPAGLTLLVLSFRLANNPGPIKEVGQAKKLINESYEATTTA